MSHIDKNTFEVIEFMVNKGFVDGMIEDYFFNYTEMFEKGYELIFIEENEQEVRRFFLDFLKKNSVCYYPLFDCMSRGEWHLDDYDNSDFDNFKLIDFTKLSFMKKM